MKLNSLCAFTVDINNRMEGFALLVFCLLLLNDMMAVSTAGDSIETWQSIRDGETIVSMDETFRLGFFSPGTSKNRYVGIWYNKVPTMTVVWVANRDKPLNDSSGVLKLNENGILVILSHNDSVFWSSNTSRLAQHPVAKLLPSGNFVVQEKNNNELEDSLWQSFDYPCDTFLPGQKLGRNLVTGLNRYITSWNSPDDPSHGRFSYQVDIDGYPQVVQRDGTLRRFRLGSWNGIDHFTGAPELRQNSIFRFVFVFTEKEAYYTYELLDKSVHHRLVITPDGFSQRSTWSDERRSWITFSILPVDECDHYATCGAYASCNTNNFPMCSCLDGFAQNTTDSSSDCVRRTSLSCHGDGFLKFSKLKLPDTERTLFNRSVNSLEDCRMLCMKNCSCTAYAKLVSDCLLWFGNLRDMKKMTDSTEDIYIRMDGAVVEAIERERSHKQKTAIIICVLCLGVLILCLAFIIYRRKKQQKEKMRGILESEASTRIDHHEEDLELPLIDMSTITSATNNFSTSNILGEGGFGTVYKGILEDGKEIAVKRLSESSSQGLQEFKNEVMHIAKLQHRNLVRLLGCCIQAEERLLVYEYMPNKSLDFFIFDKKKGMLLDWPMRLHIINGIARGLLYLHQDSRHRIVHRDLKAANVLLDCEMNPKVSDFGLARSFGGNETEANTQHVVGTYGYLSPEYIVDGAYSTKSDVFSFGVLVLEIVSGKRNRGFTHHDHQFNLLGHAWRLFTEGKGYEIVCATIRDSCNLSGVLRSIHVGLLCVQQNPDDRPSMSNVVLMLSSTSPLPRPTIPGFFVERKMPDDGSSSSSYQPRSINEITVSILEAR